MDLQQWQPGKILYKNESILDATERFILNGCHCYSNYVDNPVCAAIFQKFPHSDIYNIRMFNKSKPGAISVMGDGFSTRYVINLFIQKYPEAPMKEERDGYRKRFRFFVSSMNQTFKLTGIDEVALSNKMNVDMACFYDKYVGVIEKLAKRHPNIKTVIYTGSIFKNAANAAKI